MFKDGKQNGLLWGYYNDVSLLPLFGNWNRKATALTLKNKRKENKSQAKGKKKRMKGKQRQT